MYRNITTVPGMSPAMINALAARGIVNYCNALPPRARKSHVQVFVMADGSIVPASHSVLCEVVREIRR